MSNKMYKVIHRQRGATVTANEKPQTHREACAIAAKLESEGFKYVEVILDKAQ
jgi:hypothetical protein